MHRDERVYVCCDNRRLQGCKHQTQNRCLYAGKQGLHRTCIRRVIRLCVAIAPGSFWYFASHFG